MLSKACNYIKLNKMLEKGDRIVIGVSGGADSVCLLHVCAKICSEMELKLVVVHINHGIRGEEAARDEQFVKDMSSRLGVDFYRYSYDVKSIAREQGLSEEEAGRTVRYEAFLETCNRIKCNKIAIAHNKNDNAETVLFNLFRGSGVKGLSGIENKRIINSEFSEITIIRPLLCVERKEIEQYLKLNDIRYQTDSTNLTEDYTRNKIRNRILKYAVEEINSGAIDNIGEASYQLREALNYIELNILKRYQSLVREVDGFYFVSVREMLEESVVIRKGIILRIMENLAGKRKDLESKHVEAVLSLLSKQVGKLVNLPYRMVAEREYEEVKLYCVKETKDINYKSEKIVPIKVVVPGRTNLVQYKKVIETELINYKKNQPILKSSCAKWFDYDKIENAVEIRTRQEGDNIQINKTGGKKKLKDYFIDQKIPRKLRDSQLLIADGSDIMWIPGENDRMSEKYKVDDTTKRILWIRMCDLEENEKCQIK